MSIFFNFRQLKPRIAKAVVTALKATALAALFSANIGLANTAAELRTLQTQISKLEKSILKDTQGVRQLERIIWGLDAKVLDAQKLIRAERAQQRSDLHALKRDVKKQGFDIERLNKAVALIDQDIELVQRESQRSQDYFQSLNPIKRQFEEASHLEKLQENQLKVEKLLGEKQVLIESRTAATNKQNLLVEKLELAEAELEDSTLKGDSRFNSLIKKRETSGKKITKMRSALKEDQGRLSFLKKKSSNLKAKIAAKKKQKPNKVAAKPKAKPVIKAKASKPPEKRPAYVFVISGEQESNIEDYLKLKDWVESYGATYVQTKWNGSENNDSSNMSNFMTQFQSQLASMNEHAKIILIGHGKGGGAAIRAATEVAFQANRTIDLLAVIDPIGDQNLRANIVYDTKVSCSKPQAGDQLLNSEYIACLRESQKRKITANVKHFYNRWQKDAEGPTDYQRSIKAIDENGNDIESPTATGRFVTAGSIQTDQKRVFFDGQETAHQAILNEEARNLPRLLVKHLR